jgi:hypothetical protein
LSLMVLGQGGLILLPAFLNSLLAPHTLFQVDRCGTKGRMRAAIKLMGIMLATDEASSSGGADVA